jgi:hypothetical protein
MAKFFESFPQRIFEQHLLTDLNVRIKLKDTWLNDKKLYYIYQYQDHDKPEHLALKYYEDEQLHWLILLTNTIFDDNFDFPMNERLFKKYLERKYANSKGLKLVKILNHGSEYVSGLYDNIPLTILGEDQKVELTGVAVLGKGIDHAKYIPGLCYYRHVLEIKSSPEIDKIVEKSKGLMKAEKKGSKWYCDITDADADRIAEMDKEAIKNSDELIFVVESYGNMKAEDIFIKAIEALQDNLDEFEKSIK